MKKTVNRRGLTASVLSDEQVDDVARRVLEEVGKDRDVDTEARIARVTGGSVMNIAGLKRRVMASMSVMGVYRRLAQLSEEERQKVIDKVQEKLKQEEKEESEVSEETEGAVDAFKEQMGIEETPEPKEEKEESEVSEETESAVDTFKEQMGIEEPEETPAETPEPEAEEPAETEDVVEETTEEPEEPEPELEPEVDETGEKLKTLEDKEEQIEGMVKELAEEVKVIKSDGQVSPGEVIGLIKNMMDMVNILVDVKGPTRRKKSAAAREFLIADRVMGLKGRRCK